MTTLQTKLLAQTEDRPLNLEEIRQWLQMRNLLEYLRQQKESKRNVLPAVSEIMDDEMDAMDLDLEAYRQSGRPSFGWDYSKVEADQ